MEKKFLYFILFLNPDRFLENSKTTLVVHMFLVKFTPELQRGAVRVQLEFSKVIHLLLL